MSAERNSRAAFESIEQIVMAFGSVSMMLEATFDALFSSFRAVLGVADHFGRMRYNFKHMFATISILRVLRAVLSRLLTMVGVTPPPFLNNPPLELLDDGGEGGIAGADGTRPRSWPILMFFAVAVGGPYLIYQLLKGDSQTGSVPRPRDQRKPVEARALWDFVAENPRLELSFKANDMLTVYPPQRAGQVRCLLQWGNSCVHVVHVCACVHVCMRLRAFVCLGLHMVRFTWH